MQISERESNGIKIVALDGRFDAQTAGSVDEALIGLLSAGTTKLLIDLSAVEYVSSAGLRVLLSTAKKLAGKGGKLVLCGLKPYVYEVFEVAGFTAIFQIAPESEAGLAGF